MSDARIINPNVEIIPITQDGAISRFDVSAVVKGRGRLETRVNAGEAKSPVFAALEQLLRGRSVEIGEAAWRQLLRMGVVVTPEEVASPVRFACRLDDIREPEIPARLCPPQPASLVVNPTLRWIGFDELAEVNRKISHIWEPAERLVLVRDLRT